MVLSSLPRPHRSPWPLTRSNALLHQAEHFIPGVTLSMMKRPEHFAPGRFPVFLQSGSGAVVSDADDNEYVDFICGLGANSLGHQHPVLKEALLGTLGHGLLHSLPHELEVACVKALVDIVDGAEMARLFKTGADATSAAMRLARALTGKERILTIGYNGWHDQFMFDTPGVPAALSALTTRLPLQRPEQEAQVLDTVSAQGEELAAVLLSVPYNRVLNRDFLVELRALCSESGVKLVFDEIVTGFRIALGGVQEYFGVAPDYACFSKAMAGGMPLSAVVGPRAALQHMERLQVSTTFGGELLSLSAALACMDFYQKQKVPEHLARLGNRLKSGVNALSEELGSPLRVVGYDAIPFFLFDQQMERHGELMQVFQGAMAEHGVLLRRDVNFLCAAHTDEQIEYTLEAARKALKKVPADR